MDAPTLRTRLSGLIERGLLPLAVAGLVLGWLASLVNLPGVAAWAFGVPATLIALRLSWQIFLGLRHREAGVDIIALLAIVAAVTMDELLAAAVIGVMLAGGEALERFAESRAHRELTALLGRAPREVHAYCDGGLRPRPLSEVRPGDLLLVKPGEVVPVDGLVVGDTAVLDESALTGEANPVVRAEGDPVNSGTVNAGPPFDLRASATAEASTYSGIVRLVREAQTSKAPFVRLADRWALIFVPVVLVVAGLAWLVSGSADRALAVLVIATPCPLLLATPIAIVAGISRAAKRGVIVKGGAALESLARARVLLFDKTGTLTAGRPRLTDVQVGLGFDQQDVLRLAASLDQMSPHVLAGAIVSGARRRGLQLAFPESVKELAGAGIEGRVAGHDVAVGTSAYVMEGVALPSWARDVRRRAGAEGATNVFVRIDGRLAGSLLLEDPVRPETTRAVRALRRAGISRVVMVTGDHGPVAELVGAAIGVDAVLAERSPVDKVEAVHEERADARGPVVMVGDGINDAPALATADVGVAMGARGATASSEAADVVIAVDRLDRLAEVILIARRARAIAVQSIVVGMGLSLVGMAVAALGFLPVVAGALLQEVIDVVAILNALRALRGGVPEHVRVPGWSDTSASLRHEHEELQAPLGRIRLLADHADVMSPPELRGELDDLRTFLDDVLVPHEQAEDRTVFPMLSRALGSDDATAALHRTHIEIFHLVRLFAAALRDLSPDGPTADDLVDLRRVLYGLDAILRLHMAQEEELYVSLLEETAEETAGRTAPPIAGNRVD